MISWQRTLSPFPAWSALLRHGLSMWFVCLMLLTMMSANNRGKILVQAAWMGGSVAKPTPHISSCPNDMVRHCSLSLKFVTLLYLWFRSVISDYFWLVHFPLTLFIIFCNVEQVVIVVLVLLRITTISLPSTFGS